MSELGPRRLRRSGIIGWLIARPGDGASRQTLAWDRRDHPDAIVEAVQDDVVRALRYSCMIRLTSRRPRSDWRKRPRKSPAKIRKNGETSKAK